MTTADEHLAALSALRRDVVPTPRGEAFVAWRADNDARRLAYMLEVAGLESGDPAAAFLEGWVGHLDAFGCADLAVLLEEVRRAAAASAGVRTV